MHPMHRLVRALFISVCFLNPCRKKLTTMRTRKLNEGIFLRRALKQPNEFAEVVVVILAIVADKRLDHNHGILRMESSGFNYCRSCAVEQLITDVVGRRISNADVVS